MIILPLPLLAVPGFAQDVHYNYDRNSDFTKYKTYRWVEVDGAAHLDQLTDKQLTNAIDVELSKKGLVKIWGTDPDLLITYQAAIDQEQQFHAFTGGFGPGWGYGPGWGRGWGYAGYGTSTVTVQSTTIQVGSLGFDMYDAEQKKLVWRGEATKTIDIRAKPDKRQRSIEKGVAKLLKNYPPPTTK
jgi:Domain of unknown function (DUF4136)